MANLGYTSFSAFTPGEHGDKDKVGFLEPDFVKERSEYIETQIINRIIILSVQRTKKP